MGVPVVNIIARHLALVHGTWLLEWTLGREALHKPVLCLFSSVCGDLDGLNHHNQDISTLSDLVHSIPALSSSISRGVEDNMSIHHMTIGTKAVPTSTV